VGEDGATHAGSFDLSFLRCIPNMLIMAPSNENELRQMLYTGFIHKGPASVRYPRGTGPGTEIKTEMTPIPLGESLTVRSGKGVAILSFGSMLDAAATVAAKLNATLVDMRFIKPLDIKRILELASSHSLLVTIEENVVAGGAGSGVSEYLRKQHINTPIIHLGLPDTFVAHGKPSDLLQSCGLDASGILTTIGNYLNEDKDKAM
jgi:1-deoxy-D-xylulose-5-phosphate synthase